MTFLGTRVTKQCNARPVEACAPANGLVFQLRGHDASSFHSKGMARQLLTLVMPAGLHARNPFAAPATRASCPFSSCAA
jgi:hypothetical protein